MDVERQQGRRHGEASTWCQPSLFEGREDDVRHGAGGEGRRHGEASGTGSAASQESQALTASARPGHGERKRALTGTLMERICERTNLNRAYKYPVRGTSE